MADNSSSVSSEQYLVKSVMYYSLSETIINSVRLVCNTVTGNSDSCCFSLMVIGLIVYSMSITFIHIVLSQIQHSLSTVSAQFWHTGFFHCSYSFDRYVLFSVIPDSCYLVVVHFWYLLFIVDLTLHASVFLSVCPFVRSFTLES